MSEIKDIIIIGAGPAGLTAAIYALRAGKSVLVLEKSAFGGQINYSPKIENYPGFQTISGAELADKLVDQALEQGASIDIEEVLDVQKDSDNFKVITDFGEHLCRAVIIATGAKHRHLGVPGEEELIGKGISFCALCDGAFYTGKDVCLIGGGNSALQEALLLSETSKKLTIIQNLADFTGEKTLADVVRAKPNIECIFSTVVKEFSVNGDKISAVIRNEQTGEEREISADGFFEAIGLAPDNKPFEKIVDLSGGYVLSDEKCLTNTPGVFTAGDCRTKSVRQIVTAMSDGATAALAACDYLSK